MVEFAEVGERVWVARYPWLDLNVGLVAGRRGLLVVDTHGSTAMARQVVQDVRRLGVGDVVAVVNTHAHFDHTFGNTAFVAAYGRIPIHAHEDAAAAFDAQHELAARHFQAHPDDPRAAQVRETAVTPPTATFSSVRVLDLGERVVEILHPGRGHTAGDAVVRVPDAGVLLAGDLVEESAPPAYGPDCFPFAWPFALDVMLGVTAPGTVVVPGHGAVVDRDFVVDQRAGIGVVAQTIRDLAVRRVPWPRRWQRRPGPSTRRRCPGRCGAATSRWPRTARLFPWSDVG